MLVRATAVKARAVAGRCQSTTRWPAMLAGARPAILTRSPATEGSGRAEIVKGWAQIALGGQQTTCRRAARGIAASGPQQGGGWEGPADPRGQTIMRPAGAVGDPAAAPNAPA